MTVGGDLHNQAMDCAGRAYIARMRGDEQEAQRLFTEAYEKEVAGIEALEEDERAEPWHSVLHRSAAWLALDCNRPREAEKVAAKALAGEPHPEIAVELRDVLEVALSRRRFSERADALAAGEMEMVLAGDEVGYGFVDASEVLTRVGNSTKLVQRIVQRFADKPYKPGRLEKVVSNYGLRMSVPKAGSFAVNLQVATPSEDSEALDVNPEDVVDEFIDLMGLLNENAIGRIEKRIGDTGYFSNFLHLGKSIMPDGVRVTQVGFSAGKASGPQRSTVLIRPAYEIPTFGELEIENLSIEVEIKGRLLYANALSGKKIKVLDGEGKTHTLVVPARGILDIGKLWNSLVRVTGVYEGRNLILENIEPL